MLAVRQKQYSVWKEKGFIFKMGYIWCWLRTRKFSTYNLILHFEKMWLMFFFFDNKRNESAIDSYEVNEYLNEKQMLMRKELT